MRALRLALAASELAPYAKTGGLADVLLGLGRWLGRPERDGGGGHDVRLFLPFYERVAKTVSDARPLPNAQQIDVRFPNRTIRFGVREGRLPQSEVPVYFVDCPELYFREGIYTDDGDESLRFAMLSRAVLETRRGSGRPTSCTATPGTPASCRSTCARPTRGTACSRPPGR